MKAADAFVVAVKDVTTPGKIRMGKILGRFRKREFVDRAFHKLASRTGLPIYCVGIFQNGQLV